MHIKINLKHVMHAYGSVEVFHTATYEKRRQNCSKHSNDSYMPTSDEYLQLQKEVKSNPKQPSCKKVYGLL